MAQGWNKAHSDSYNTYWQNYPSIDTPIIKDELNRMEVCMDTEDDRILTLDTVKAEQSDFLPSLANLQFQSSTGTFIVTRNNGVSYNLDTDIEKIAVNFDYDDDPTSAHYQNLIITLEDGTVKYVDMSALITEYEFSDTSTIHFAVSNSGVISANVIDGSITESKLQPNFLADCRSARTGAETAEADAIAKALVSEGWAVGTQNGTAVTSGSPYYHNNSKWYKDQAQQIADQGLGGLGDVTIDTQTLANGQLLEYNANTQQWENNENKAIAWKYNDVAGAKNILPYPYYESNYPSYIPVGMVYYTYSDGGVLYVNGDDLGARTYNIIQHNYTRALSLPAETYTLSMPNNKGFILKCSSIDLSDNITTVCQTDGTSEVTFTASSSVRYLFDIISPALAESFSDFELKPMLRISKDTNSDWDKSTKTNEELTDRLFYVSRSACGGAPQSYYFNSDGSIDCISDDYTQNISFLPNGNIRTTVISDKIVTIKLTSFSVENEITEEYTQSQKFYGWIKVNYPAGATVTLEKINSKYKEKIKYTATSNPCTFQLPDSGRYRLKATLNGSNYSKYINATVLGYNDTITITF